MAKVIALPKAAAGVEALRARIAAVENELARLSSGFTNRRVYGAEIARLRDVLAELKAQEGAAGEP